MINKFSYNQPFNPMILLSFGMSYLIHACSETGRQTFHEMQKVYEYFIKLSNFVFSFSTKKLIYYDKLSNYFVKYNFCVVIS